MNCPVCKGTGKLQAAPFNIPNEQEFRRRVARTLTEKGYSLRQIAKMLGYRSPESVRYLLRAK